MKNPGHMLKKTGYQLTRTVTRFQKYGSKSEEELVSILAAQNIPRDTDFSQNLWADET